MTSSPVSLAVSPDGVLLSGLLRKQCSGGHGYNQRWFQLSASHLYEFRGKSDRTPKLIISLAECMVAEDLDHKHSFTLSGPYFPRTFHLKCVCDEQKYQWMSAIRRCVASISTRNSSVPTPQIPQTGRSVYGGDLLAMPLPTVDERCSSKSSSVDSNSSAPLPCPPGICMDHPVATPRQKEQQLLQDAIHHGDLATIARMLESNVDLNKPIGSRQVTALHLACEVGHYPVVVQLLQRGAVLMARDCQNSTPLHFAVAKGHPSVVRCLLESPSIDVQAKDVELNTPLHIACKGAPEALDCVDMLLAAKADILAINGEFQTPLHFASGAASVEVLKLLLDNLEDMQIPVPSALSTTDAQLNTPLHWACLAGRMACVDLLLQNGAVTASCNSAGQTPADILRSSSPTPSHDLLERLKSSEQHTAVPAPPHLPAMTSGVIQFTEEMWRSGKFLGKGSFGEVRRCLDPCSGRLFVAKQLFQRLDQEEGRLSASRELFHLQTLHHPNIVRYICHHIDHPYIYLCLEYVEGGSLYEVIERHGCIGMELMKRYVRQILTGLQYLHDNDVLHRDVKPHNLLVTRKARLKLADFGGAKQLAAGDGTTQSDNAHCTPAYAAPEIYNDRQYHKGSDVWSVGCTVLHMATGQPPWAMQVEQGCAGALQILYKLKRRQRPTIPQDGTLAEVVVNFIELCTAIEHTQRPTCASLLTSHPLLVGYQGNDISDILLSPS